MTSACDCRPHQDRARSGAMGASAAELDAFVDVAMGRRDVTTLELLPAGQVRWPLIATLMAIDDPQ